MRFPVVLKVMVLSVIVKPAMSNRMPPTLIPEASVTVPAEPPNMAESLLALFQFN